MGGRVGEGVFCLLNTRRCKGTQIKLKNLYLDFLSIAGVPFRLPHWRGWKHGQGVTRDDDKTYKPVDTNQNGKSDDISGDERGSKDDGCKVDEDEGKVGNAIV